MEKMETAPKRYSFLNTYVNALSMKETVQYVEQIIEARVPTQHVVINASKINLMQEDKTLTRIINGCPLINADGASIVWASKKMGIPLTERVTGIDLFYRLVALSAAQHYRIYLFGARQEVVEKVRNVLMEKYPNLEIVGYRNGYFSEEDEPCIVQEIAQSRADIVFVAFSSPKKEYWINKYLDELSVPFVMGVGGTFDVVAGVTDRAPAWMQKTGLEWFYRFIQEPKRLWRRYIIGNIKFISLVYRSIRREGHKRHG